MLGEDKSRKVLSLNDLFGNTDKYYTNALQLTWLSKDLEEYKDDVRLPDWSLPLFRLAPFVNEPESMHNVGLILGQQIYTPADIYTHKLIPNDRPYAGFLYSGLALHSKTIDQLDTIELIAGVVGPSALGEQAQNTVHRIRDLKQAQGWEHQLRDEPALRLSWQRKWRTWEKTADCHLGADLIPSAGLTVGNVLTAANAGTELRFGYRLPRDFGSDVIRPGTGVSVPEPSEPRAAPWGRFGLHMFAAAQVQAVAHNIFLDGNTWKDSHSVDKHPVVADVSLGLALNYERFKLTYRHLFRTQEFTRQDEPQVIGSLTLTWAF
ncbi:MAG: lipid A deacylase LpxR family protein [Desulfovermiculus sp.]|nr:lipid A deacylase LpxR family protein [Desulfovermiculus sp.]